MTWTAPRGWASACLLASLAAAATATQPINLRLAAEGVYVGAAPADASAWEALAARGVRTVVGVEGEPPMPPAGSGSGVRLIHIPIGYDGIDPGARDQLTRVAREAGRPLYLYCHHGRHRGPAAAAIVCRAAGLLDEEGALDLLRRAHTDPKYAGLWRNVATYQAPPADAQLPGLTPASSSTPLSLAMCRLDRAWESARKSDTREDRREAMLLVVESLKESRRAAEGAPPALVERLGQTLEHALELERATGGRGQQMLAEAFGARCLLCHATHRDGAD